MPRDPASQPAHAYLLMMGTSTDHQPTTSSRPRLPACLPPPSPTCRVAWCGTRTWSAPSCRAMSRSESSPCSGSFSREAFWVLGVWVFHFRVLGSFSREALSHFTTTCYGCIPHTPVPLYPDTPVPIFTILHKNALFLFQGISWQLNLHCCISWEVNFLQVTLPHCHSLSLTHFHPVTLSPSPAALPPTGASWLDPPPRYVGRP